MKRFRVRRGFAVLWTLVFMAALLELSLGPMTIPIHVIPQAAWQYFHGTNGTTAVVIGAIRLPRLLMAALVGAGLASSGAVLQAIFRNPMADPALIGVSSGASLGAVLTIQFGLARLTQWFTPAGAFVSGLIVVFVIYRLATVQGRTSIYALLLSGVAITSLCGSIVTLLISIAPLATMHQMLFWLLGGLDGVTWRQVIMVAVFVIVGFSIYLSQSNALDLISLGEEQAAGTGVPIQFTKQATLVTSAFVVGACVSSTGVIGFVGLLVPHLLRIWMGPSHRRLIVACALGGAVLVLLADTAARTLLMPIELNVGIVTSCLGAPFFLFLLRRQETHAHRG